VSIGITPLDPNGARGGAPLVYTRHAQDRHAARVDSTGTDAAQLELECTIDGLA
jgi:hypothetical protein